MSKNSIIVLIYHCHKLLVLTSRKLPDQTRPGVVRQEHFVMGTAEPRTNNDYAGKG
jgi:hypothetical protein